MAGKPDTARTVLVTRFSALGDVALSIPVLYSVCRRYPDVRFVMITRPLPASLFIGSPDNLTVETVDTELLRGLHRLRRFALSLRKRYRPDCVVDLHDVLRTKIIRTVLRMCGVPNTVIRKDRRGKRALTRRHSKHLVQLTPTWQRYADAFSRAGLPAAIDFQSLFTPEFPIPASVAARKPDGAHWLAIAPFARHEGKEYPLPLMERAIALITEANPNVRILLFGARSNPREWKTMTAWEAKYPAVSTEAAGEPLHRQLEILALCDTMLSMDSANMHLASLVGVPVVSVWGATHPFCGFLGYGQQVERAVQLDMVCRPCSVFGAKPCRRADLHCLRAITPQRVAHAAVDTLMNYPAPPA